jgi:hypothetical protein
MRWTILAMTAVVAAAVILAALEFVPTTLRNRPDAAAAELHQIALNAARQSVPELANGQYLLTDQRVIFAASIGQIGNQPTPNANATVTASIREWANDQGGSCIEATSGPAMFASPSNEAAWKAAGLLVDPSNPTSTTCALVGTGVIDASKLPTNAARLAKELNNGTTGVPTLDQAQDFGSNGGFDRAVLLLIGPTVGTSPSFNAALFDAMAKLQGVTDLGQRTTASGQVGVAFSVPSSPRTSVLIIDPSTGALLEVHNIPDQQAFTGFGGSYLPTTLPPSGGISYSVSIQQLDPISAPTVSQLPAGLTPPLPLGSSGTVTATTNPGVTDTQVFELSPQLQSAWGKAGVSSTTAADGATVYTYSFNGSQDQINGYATILRNSGLFSSVTIHGPASR